MSNKKFCESCGKKFRKSYDFCPYCGEELTDGGESKKRSENFGLLGKNDSGVPKEELKIPGGFNLIFNSLMKNLEKQFKEIEKDSKKEQNQNNKDPKVRKQGISINISTSGGNRPPMVNVASYGNSIKKKKQEVRKAFSDNFSKEKLKKLQKLPREEPKTNIKRLSNRVVYEIELPGVKSLSDISMINLENGVGIKAISNDKVYSKSIQMEEPINYNFSEGRLFLEFRNK